LIVADIASAGGWDGLAAVLALPEWSGRTIPVLALVQGEIDEAAAARAAALGITDILSRPMSAATLRAGIASMIPVPPGAGNEAKRFAA
jgi:CheY-like chemotaxis protein